MSATPAAPVANGSYRLINRSSGLALDDAGNGGVGTGLIQWTYSGAANQRWTLTSVGAYYTITCAANGLVASANGSTAAGAPIVLALPASSSDQLWTITPQSGGYYVLANRLSGLVLNDRDSSTAAGNPIDQAALGGGGAQQWSILPP